MYMFYFIYYFNDALDRYTIYINIKLLPYLKHGYMRPKKEGNVFIYITSSFSLVND